MTDVDVVYPVRDGEKNEELRWSLRTVAANLPHRRVWIAGYRPSWVSDEVGHIPTVQKSGARSKYRNSTGNVRAAVDHPDVADRFVLMNDDFFILAPVEEVPVLYRGVAADYVAEIRARYGTGASPYRDGLEATARLCTDRFGVDGPLCYELHVPLPVDKTKMAATLDVADEEAARFRDVAVHKRTLYGNQWGISGTRSDDVKVTFRAPPVPWPEPFLSTSPSGWSGFAGRTVRAMFADLCRYEEDVQVNGRPVARSRVGGRAR